MKKVIVFHYEEGLRERLGEALRRAGYVAYTAPDVTRAWEAVLALKPDVVVTDFPAYLPSHESFYRTLTEAIRSSPEMQHVVIVNLTEPATPHMQSFADIVGITQTISSASPVEQIVEAIQSLATAEPGGSEP